MSTPEPIPTAWFLTLLGTLLAASALASRFARRSGIPVVLMFVGVGMLAGSEGPGRVAFENYSLGFRLGSAALCLILFDGGLNTSLATLRSVLAPSGVLATLGVLLSAGFVALGAKLFGLPWTESLLLGAVVSSTDAAAVFSVLRGSRLRVRARIAATLEVESGLNDPVAVAATLALTHVMSANGAGPGGAALHALVQLVVGGVLGIALGLFARWLLPRVHPAASGLYPVLTIAVALLAFGLPTLFSGSGFLGVYAAGVVLGNGPLPYRSGLLRAHDFVAWGSQVAMFLTLGLLVFPSRLVAIWPTGLAIALWLTLLARPAAVFLCLAPFRYSWRERLYVSWVGLRGAVPIILAMFPVLAGLGSGPRLFDLVFFVVVVSVLLQGSTTPWLTRKLKLGSPAPPSPPAVLEIASRHPLGGDVVSYFLGPETAVTGLTVRDIPSPAGDAIVLVVRGQQLLPRREDLVLEGGDHVYVIASAADRAEIELLFGLREI